MIITSLPSTHNIPATRTAIIPKKTCSTTEVDPNKSLRLLASASGTRQPSSTRSSPHGSKASTTPRSSSPLKKAPTPPAARASPHNLRQQHLSAPPKRSLQSNNTTDKTRNKKLDTTKVIAKEKNDGTRVTNKQVNVTPTEPYDMKTENHTKEVLDLGVIHSDLATRQDSSINHTTHLEEYNQNLEAQLKIVSGDLIFEKGLVESMKLEMQQLKVEIIRLQQQPSAKHDIDIETQDLTEENEKLRSMLAQAQEEIAETHEKRKIDEQKWTSRYRALEQENEILKSSQMQTEAECIRLMDELLAYERADNSTMEGMDEIMYRREIEHLKIQLSREQKHSQDLEEAQLEKLEKHKRDMFELECLIESRVFKETELESAVEAERQKVRELEEKLQEEQEKNLDMIAPRSFTPDTRSRLNRTESIYCEICEEYGHEVITCTALDENPCYCINCDVYDLHSSEECPNQDETF